MNEDKKRAKPTDTYKRGKRKKYLMLVQMDMKTRMNIQITASFQT